jgi:hypothetical protein
MLKRWRAEIVALVVAIGIGVAIGLILGLGGGESESDRVSAAASSYLQSFADNDPQALCQDLSPAVQARMKAGQLFGGGSCEDTARSSIAKVPARERAALKDPKITVVTVDGNKAAVRFEPKLNGSDVMQLVKVGENWRVNSS